MRSLVAAACLLFCLGAGATTFHVGCSGTDTDLAQLIGALDFANNESDFPGPDTIELAAGCTYTFHQADNYWYGPNALPPIASEVVIEGNGATIARGADGSAPFRFLYVSGGLAGELPAGKLSLRKVTLRGGLVRGGASKSGGAGAGMGGAVFNQGTLRLDRVTLWANAAAGGFSGTGSANSGGGMGEDAQADMGGGFGGQLSGGPYGGAPDGGGGGFVPGTGDAVATQGGGLGGLGDLGRADGGTGNSWGGRFGAGGSGGGYGGGGGVGGGGGYGQNGLSGGTGSGGFGGGGAYGRPGGNGGFGGGGGTGAVAAAGTGGFGAANGDGAGRAGGGGAGMGGAIFNHRGALTLINCTLTLNEADGGFDLADGTLFGSGMGAAIFNLNGSVQISFSTIAWNRLRHTSAAASDAQGPAAGAVYSLSYGNRIEDGTASAAVLTIENSIVFGTSFNDINPTDEVVNNVVAGANVANSGNTATVRFDGANIVGTVHNVGTLDPNSISTRSVNPKLMQIAANGASSAPWTVAIDGGPAQNTAVGQCPATDERGVARPQFGACDVGAFELSAADDWIFADGYE